ncbi:glycosyltransferase family 2 protein [Candidatus Dojkabacteria bacterium]|uniref:Glycosyltransferase family 2 protein n=1 Tax=Candidatus Dojkabacteria bacterium TaxID=2099670 RepID=A0A847VDG1_9BACT|nr:glycosyltransferase family 2 protein [Candidatus Dojkabacteria bacterium]
MNTLVVIVNHNGKKLLQRSISSLLNTESVVFDICVVDNNSSDDSVDFLKKEYPGILLVKSSKNLGYGRAHNLAYQYYPNYDYYLFLNNDITVSPNWLDSMFTLLKQKESIGVVGPKILLSKKREGKYVINSAGMDIDKHYLAYDRYEGEYDSSKYSITEEVDGICGAVMLIPKEVFEKVKGFHPKMFLYYEDVDLCLRIRDKGYHIYYCGNSVVYHEHMASTEGMGSYRRNRMNIFNRYVSIRDRLGLFIAIRETLWYLYSWIVWKILYSKNITLKQYLDDK